MLTHVLKTRKNKVLNKQADMPLRQIYINDTLAFGEN